MKNTFTIFTFVLLLFMKLNALNSYILELTGGHFTQQFNLIYIK